MKKLINLPSNVVREMLEGIAIKTPQTSVLDGETVLTRVGLPDASVRAVAVVSGGGSGHEPAHAGYVGKGMLTAAVCGEVFTSPSTDAVLAAIRATAGQRGALLIVKNYTGDRLNFGLAAELARGEGIPVEVVTVADDVSLRARTPRNQSRGLAGTVLVHKIAGAAAALGWSLDKVAAAARAAADDLGSMGVALDGCTLPGAEKAGFSLGDDEIELGLGIHGEKGVERTTPKPADELTAILLDNIVGQLALKSGERVALFVNGLGATSELELAIVLRAAFHHLTARGVIVERVWSGTFLSALNMPGCSISVLRLNDERLLLLDTETDAHAWPRGGGVNRQIQREANATQDGAPDAPVVAEAALNRDDPAAREWAARLQPAMKAVAEALIANEAHFTELDSRAGDGDLGASMTRAAEAILSIPAAHMTSPNRALVALGNALRRAIAGSSGPFYATALLRAARYLPDDADPTAEHWATAFRAAASAIGELGGATVGDRTMLDALVPASEVFEQKIRDGEAPAQAWTHVVRAADRGAQDTADMTPRAGRASYLGSRAIGVPDGGAVAIACWLRALQSHIR